MKGYLHDEDKKRLELQDYTDTLMRDVSLGGRIKTIRNFYELTQKEFGEKLKITHAHVSKIEAQKDLPSNSLLSVIQNVYNIREEWINGKNKTRVKMINNYSIFTSNLKYLRELKDITKHGMALLLSIDIADYNDLETGKMLDEKEIPLHILETLKGYFDISVFDFFNTSLYISKVRDSPDGLSTEERELLDIYKTCSLTDKKMILGVIRKFRR